MTFARALLATICLTTISVQPKVDLTYRINFSDLQGPFDGKTNVETKLVIRNCNENGKLTITYKNIKTNAIVVYQEYDMKSINNHLFSLNYLYEFRDRLTSSGLELTFTIKENDVEIKNKKIILYPKQANTINGFDYTYKPYEIKNRTFRIFNDSIQCTSESFSFQNTVSTLLVNDQNYIDLTEMNFAYNFNTSFEFKCSEAYLKINDKFNTFHYLTKDKDGNIFIPINLIQNSNDINFEFKNKMYVNPNTLDMSLVEKEDYIETDKFYINPDKIAKFEKGDFEFVINDAGYNETNILLPMEIRAFRQAVGYCYDSTYCISGGIIE